MRRVARGCRSNTVGREESHRGVPGKSPEEIERILAGVLENSAASARSSRISDA